MINTIGEMLRWFAGNSLNVLIGIVLTLFLLLYLGLIIIILNRLLKKIRMWLVYRRSMKKKPSFTTVRKKRAYTKQQDDTEIITKMKQCRTLFGQKKYKRAIEIYTEIISSCPRHSLAFYNRGVVNYKLQKYTRAGYDFISAAKLGNEKARQILESEGVEYKKFDELNLVNGTDM